MYCPHCGNEIPDASVFCGHCGRRQGGPQAASAPATAAFEAGQLPFGEGAAQSGDLRPTLIGGPALPPEVEAGEEDLNAMTLRSPGPVVDDMMATVASMPAVITALVDTRLPNDEPAPDDEPAPNDAPAANDALAPNDAPAEEPDGSTAEDTAPAPAPQVSAVRAPSPRLVKLPTPLPPGQQAPAPKPAAPRPAAPKPAAPKPAEAGQPGPGTGKDGFRETLWFMDGVNEDALSAIETEDIRDRSERFDDREPEALASTERAQFSLRAQKDEAPRPTLMRQARQELQSATDEARGGKGGAIAIALIVLAGIGAAAWYLYLR